MMTKGLHLRLLSIHATLSEQEKEIHTFHHVHFIQHVLFIDLFSFYQTTLYSLTLSHFLGLSEMAAHSIVPQVGAIENDIIGWRRHLHKHPELSFKEHEVRESEKRKKKEDAGSENGEERKERKREVRRKK